MPRTSTLKLPINPNLQEAFAKLHPTVEAFLSARDFIPVPDDTPDLQFTQQAEEALLDHIKDHLAPIPVNGLALHEDVVHKSRVLTTGCDSIDTLLLNGLREGHVTEFAGGLAVGKTQLCLQMTAVTAWRGERVIYFDTGQAFSARRVVEMAAALHPAQRQDGSSLSTQLANIDLHECHSAQSLISMLGKVDETLQESPPPARASLLIVDSVAALIPASLGLKNSMQGHSLMIQIAVLLKCVADRHKLAVVVTNFTVAGKAESIKPAMGESWRNQPHTRVIMTRQDKADGPSWSAVRAASQIAASGARAEYVICSQGVMSPANLAISEPNATLNAAAE